MINDFLNKNVELKKIPQLANVKTCLNRLKTEPSQLTCQLSLLQRTVDANCERSKKNFPVKWTQLSMEKYVICIKGVDFMYACCNSLNFLYRWIFCYRSSCSDFSCTTMCCTKISASLERCQHWSDYSSSSNSYFLLTTRYVLNVSAKMRVFISRIVRAERMAPTLISFEKKQQKQIRFKKRFDCFVVPRRKDWVWLLPWYLIKRGNVRAFWFYCGFCE